MARHVSTSQRARYEHRQTGWPMLCSASVPFLFLAGWRWLQAAEDATRDLPAMLVPLLAGFTVLALCFSWLTTVVTDRAFVFRFGIGLVRRAIPLDEIRHVSVEASRWYEGWGIHWTRRGMLYNVGGFATVAIELANGKRLRVGSDDAVRLRGAIERAIERDSEGRRPRANR